MSNQVYVYEHLDDNQDTKEEYDLSEFVPPRGDKTTIDDQKIGQYNIVVHDKFHFIGNLYKQESSISNFVKIGWDSLTNRVSVTRKSPTDIYKSVRDAIVTLTIVHKNEAWVGSGFFIKHNNEKYICTAAHNVVEHMRNTRVDKMMASVSNINNSGNHKVVTCSIVGVAGYADIAILKVNEDVSQQHYLQWGKSKTVVNGSTCYVLGDPRGVDAISISKGVVRDNKYIYGTTIESLCISAPIYGGNSGGPIVNTFGKTIGLVSFGHDGTDTLSWGCAQCIAQRVSENIIDSQQDYVGGTLNADLLPVDAMYCHFLNRVPSLLVGYFVHHTKNKSLNNFDVIESINKKPIGLYNGQHTPCDIYMNPDKSLDMKIGERIVKVKVERLSLEQDVPNGNVNVDMKTVGPVSKHGSIAYFQF